ncbi:ABC-three component system middle component 2 [Lysinibacillus sp. NPDC058147]|uniref:ABC-three component system middle component 2 n=1 Tax=unclassified Lysinibacillus TaxID=2636778 RepID=UPI0036DD99C8
MEIYNTSFEVGIRCMVILEKMSPRKLSVDQLSMLDYLLTNDALTDNTQLHPIKPNSQNELIIRRAIIVESINLLINKSLIDINYTENGILYSANSFTVIFLNLLETTYTLKIKTAGDLLSSKFGDFTEDSLKNYIYKMPKMEMLRGRIY